MKRIISLLLTLLLLFTLTACGGGDTKQEETQGEQAAEAAVEEAVSETEQAAEEEAAAEETAPETAEAVEETEEATQAAAEPAAGMPEGELWVDVPEGFELQADTSGNVSQMVEDTLEGTSMEGQDTQATLYFVSSDGSNLNLVMQTYDDQTEESVRAIYEEMDEDYILSIYQEIDPEASISSFEHIEVDGAPGVKMSVDFKLYGFSVHCDQIQSANLTGNYTWTFTDISGEHADAFAESMASAHYTTEKSAAAMAEEYRASHPAQEDTDNTADGTRIAVTVPEGFTQLSDDGTTRTYSNGETYIVCTTMDMGDTSVDQLEYALRSISKEGWEELLGSELSSYEQIKIDGRDGIIFSMVDADAGLIRYLVGPTKRDNMWALIDSEENLEELFLQMVNSAAIE